MQVDREFYSMHGKVHRKNVSSHFLHTWTLDVLFLLFHFHLEASYVGPQNENFISVNIFLIAYLALLKGRFLQTTAIILIAGFVFVLGCCWGFF